MDTTQRLIIALMKAAVTGEAQPLSQGYSLEEAMPIIKKQGLATLAYEGGVLCGFSPKDPNMQELFKIYCQILFRSERQMRKVEEVFQAFEENSIDYLPFKGCVIKSLYPRPELRTMSDADILIRAEQYESIVPIMKMLDFQLTLAEESVMTWSHKDLCVELHRNFYAPADEDLFVYHENVWQQVIKQTCFRYSLSKEDTFLHLFTHFVKHYRSSGVGIKHVLDLWVFRCSNPDMDEAYVAQELTKLQMKEFYENVLRLLEYWFSNGTQDDIISLMTEWIFSLGTFNPSESSEMFKTLREIELLRGRKNARLQYYRRVLFPALRIVQVKYPFLKKFPWLLPVAWVLRGIDVLLYKRRKIEKIVRTGKSISDEELSNRKQALEFVGLGFHKNN